MWPLCATFPDKDGMCFERCSEQAVHVGTWDCQGEGLGAASDRTEVDSSELHVFSSSVQYSKLYPSFS